MKRSTTHNIELDANEIKAIITEHVVRSGKYNPNDKFDISFEVKPVYHEDDDLPCSRTPCGYNLTGCKVSITLS